MKQQVYEEKIEALSHIFKSHAEYAQLAKTLNLSSSQKIQIFQSPQKVHPQQAVATKRTPIKGTVSGINYNPEVDYKTEYNALSGITTFSKNATHIRIYIDETWP